MFVRRLRDSGYTTAIVSATKRSNLEIYRTQNEKMRRKAPIDECFSLALTREDAPRLKPCPDIYLRALALLGLSAADCIAFEDSLAASPRPSAPACRSLRSMTATPRTSARRSRHWPTAPWPITNLWCGTSTR